MNCWDILGIEPTTDIAVIKKAYSEAVKLHHPEDDPEGFQEVRKAYKDASSYAHYTQHQTGFSDDRTANREQSEKSSDTQFSSVFENTANNTNTEGPAAAKPEDFKTAFENIDYNGYYSQYNSSGEAPENNDDNDETYTYFNKIREEIKAEKVYGPGKVIDQFFYNYRNCRNSYKSWHKLFTSEAFRKLMKNETFTDEFINILTHNIDFNKMMYNILFRRMLIEWGYLWAGHEYQKKLANLSLIKTRLKPGKATYIAIVSMFIFFIIFVRICWLAHDASDSNHDNAPEVPNRYEISADSNYNFLTPETINEILNDMKATVRSDIIAGNEYNSETPVYQQAGISKEEYDQLLENYKQQGINYLEDYLEQRFYNDELQPK